MPKPADQSDRPPVDTEFATERVPPSHQVGWLKVALVSAMVAFSLPSFVTGAEIYLALDNDRAFAALLIGCAMLTVIAAISGIIGTRTHLSSYMLAKIAFGGRGAALVNVAFAISLIGWFGVNIDLFSGALIRLFDDTLGISAPAWAIELAGGVAMTVTTLVGFKAINWLSMLLVPVMMVVTALLLDGALSATPLSELLGATQDETLSLGDAISSVVGGVIIGAVILPDITRFIRLWQGALYTALLSYLIVEAFTMVIGGFAADSAGNSDLLSVFIAMGLSWGAFAIIIAGSWVLNSLNLYSASLSIEATLPRLDKRWLIIGLGAFGTLAAFANILDHFLDFLFYLAIVFVPVAGIIAADHFLARPDEYTGELAIRERGVSRTAMLAWLLGSAVALLGAEGVLTISGIAALDAMIISAAAYLLISRMLAPFSSDGTRG